MQNILNSAAKVVFILMALASVIALFLGKLEAKDFMLLASMTFSFYFAMPAPGGSELAGSGK